MWDKIDRFLDVTFRLLDILVVLVAGGLGAALTWYILGATEASELARFGLSALGFLGSAVIGWIVWHLVRALS